MSLQYKYSITTSVSLDNETSRMLYELCKELDLSKSQAIRKAIKIMYYLFKSRSKNTDMKRIIKRVLKHLV